MQGSKTSIGAILLGSRASSSPPSVALRPRVAARSPKSGASLPATEAGGFRREMRSVFTLALSATLRCDAPAHCGAFADKRRIVPDDGGGRLAENETHVIASGGVAVDERARPWSRRPPRALR